MNKFLKLILIIFSILVMTVIIDLICIAIIRRPLFAIRTKNDDSINKVYNGIFYDTYDCAMYSNLKLKSKKSKFSCEVDRIKLKKVISIEDTTKNMINFACAEALERFYEDEKYEYFYNCIKSKYVIVKYEGGYKETVKDALKYGTIKISDLDKYNIDYIRYEK